jgi:AcrR family transcriptional regulator
LLELPRRPKTTPRRSPRQRRSQDTVEVLMAATEKVLTRDGFARATTNRIAEAAGVSIGTLYHFFPTKEALVEALVHRMWADELAMLESRAAVLAQAPLEDAVRELVAVFVAEMKRRHVLYRRWYGEASHLGQLDLGLDLTARGTHLVRLALEQNRSRVRPRDLDFAADFVVKMVLAAVRTASRDWMSQVESGEFTEELVAMVTRYLLA